MGRGDDVAHCRLNRRTPDPSFECSSKARAQSAKIIYSNPASDIVRSVKTTANDQNNNIQRYLHIFKAQKSSKSGWTVQGIVQSVSESLSIKWNRRFEV